MILQLRIDERLIHGQIATAWSRFLNVDGIVVANDAAAANEMTTKVLRMSAPAGMKVLIKPVADSIKTLRDPRSESMRILIIVSNPADALVMAKELNIGKVNVGNYVQKQSEGKIALSQTITADEEDIKIFEELARLPGAEVYHQMIPATPQIPLKELLEKVT